MKELLRKLSNLFSFSKENRLVNENGGTAETGGDQPPPAPTETPAPEAAPAPAEAPLKGTDAGEMLDKAKEDIKGLTKPGLSPETEKALGELEPSASPESGVTPPTVETGKVGVYETETPKVAKMETPPVDLGERSEADAEALAKELDKNKAEEPTTLAGSPRSVTPPPENK